MWRSREAKMPKVWNKRDPNVPVDAVYVGRPTKWGNPFVIGKDGDRREVINLYTLHIQQLVAEFVAQSGITLPRPGWSLAQEALAELRGKDLVCWCAPLPCHADVLLEIANGEAIDSRPE